MIKTKGITLKKYIVISLIFIVLCDWSNPRDNPYEPVAGWDSETGPRIADATADSLALRWRHVERALSYRIYFVNSWGPPIIETFISKTGTNACAIQADRDISDRIYHVCAEDSWENVLDCRVLQGYYSQIVQLYPGGAVSYNFNNIAELDDSIFVFRVSDSQLPYADLSGDNLRINASANFTNFYFGYEPQGKRFVRVSLDFFQHRETLNSSGAGVAINSYANNLDHVIIGHSFIGGTGSSGIEYYNYDPVDYGPEKVNSSLNSPPRFDEWFTRTFILNTQSGDLTITEEGVATNKTLPWTFPSKLIISFIVWSTGSGDYIIVDNLSIDASDDPF